MEAKETTVQDTIPATEGQSTPPAANTQPEDNGAANGKEKTFTQDEVNRIVSERLSRERERAEHAQSSEVEEREKNISSRENALECREFISESKLPKQLLDLFDTSDAKAFKASVNSLLDKFPEIRSHDNPPMAWGQEHGSSPLRQDDFSEAFKPNI